MMMRFLPQETMLGRLEVVEVFEYYDRPLLFACRNQANAHFLATLAEETDDSDVWLYAPVSHFRLQHIRSGHIDLYDAFTKTEDGILYQVTQPYDDARRCMVDVLRSDLTSRDLLPLPGSTLSLPTRTLPIIESIEVLAREAQRVFVKLGLAFPGVRRTEAPVLALGRALVNFQELVRVTADYVIGREGARGTFPADIRERTELAYTGASAGSFQVILAEASTQPQLPGFSVIEKVLEEITDLVVDTSDPEKLAARLNNYQPRFTSRYLTFLKDLRAPADSTTIDWASPVPGRGSSGELSNLVVQSAISLIESVTNIETREFVVTGRLNAGDLDLYKFRIATNEMTYRGDIQRESLEALVNKGLGQLYEATIREITTRRAATEQPKIEYELLDLRPLVSA